ncbi:MAG TPA: FHA domain-containing protein [Kofleriaceae bacterium]|jgi:pSer/pThr/pTyr-binding forkhead associated (FHA) protein
MFKLVIQDDEGKTTVVPLIRDEITIGRKEGNTIRLTERNVSRRHARILRNNGDVQIEDLGSYNGIRVNNARIAERVSLRVSDQVQIGDYKLYLKAEGVEQVDDARTMPIERVDQLPTEAMSPLSGLSANQVPTAPMSVAPGAASGLASQQMVGSPNRTMVALSDTDPSGRPVASAAAVAALTAPVGYGRLVVLSSNFAGKEFELSRPQMIVGRTDENDIVINHRSISRNHAKLVREPETGRYTISDLQSSNGVRVNGQDYGKVELRRGDVVDLGHVRLRFVEPGEDFLFSRDAVITDVPETGKKRGMMVALLLGVVVVAAVVVVFVMKGSDKPSTQPTAGGSGQQGLALADGGNGSAIAAIGSNGPDVAMNPPAVEPDAPTGKTVPTAAGADKAAVIKDCKEQRANRNWQDLQNCADKLAGLGGDEAADFRTTALAETKADLAMRKMQDRLKEKDWRGAQGELKHIPDSSVYRTDAQQKFDDAQKGVLREQVGKAEAFARAGRCKEIATLAAQAESTMTADIADAIRKTPCTQQVSVAPPPPDHVTPPPPDHVTPPQPPKGDCESPEEATKHAESQYSAGFAGQALTTLEKALSCKSDGRLMRMAALYSCRAKNGGKAKQYYGKLEARFQAQIQQACLQEGISLP